MTTVQSSEAATSKGALARRIARVVGTPPPAPGFIGEGHLAVEVLDPGAFAASDPFVLLMDDRLALGARRKIGGAHPHAGLETVTLVLEGSVRDRDEGELVAGEAVWMTAGRGVIHNEHVEAGGDVRILQLWIGLPERSRYAPPALQVVRAASLPVHRAPGVVARLYSGESAGLRSPTRNLVPVTLVELLLEPGASFEQTLPASYNGFVYVVAGEVRAGEPGRAVRAGEVGWLEAASGTGSSALRFEAGATGARAVLYAGEPLREALVQRGPFVGESNDTIARFFREFQSGRFTRLSELGRATEPS